MKYRKYTYIEAVLVHPDKIFELIAMKIPEKTVLVRQDETNSSLINAVIINSREGTIDTTAFQGDYIVIENGPVGKAVSVKSNKNWLEGWEPVEGSEE